MDVRIGVTQGPRELDVEMPDDTDRAALLKDIERLLDKGDGVLWLTDRRGRRVGVPVAKISHIEVSAQSEDRRVGFGAP